MPRRCNGLLLATLGLAFGVSCDGEDPPSSPKDTGAADAESSDAEENRDADPILDAETDVDVGFGTDAETADATVDPDAGMVDSGCAPGESQTGIVTVMSGRAAVNGITEIAAVFYPSREKYAPSCRVQSIGKCELADCPDDPRPTPPPYADTGTLTVTSPLATLLSLPGPDGDYKSSEAIRLWESDGWPISVSSPDLDLKYPFGREGTSPPIQVRFQAPRFYGAAALPINVERDLELVWEPQRSGQINFELEQRNRENTVRLDCTFSSTIGHAEIPSEAFTGFSTSAASLDLMIRRTAEQRKPGRCGEVDSFRFELESPVKSGWGGFGLRQAVDLRDGLSCNRPRLLTLIPAPPAPELAAHDQVYLRNRDYPRYSIQPPPTLCVPSPSDGLGIWYAIDLPPGRTYDVTVLIETQWWDAHAAILDSACMTSGSCGVTAGGGTALTADDVGGRVYFFVQELYPSNSAELVNVSVSALPH